MLSAPYRDKSRSNSVNIGEGWSPTCDVLHHPHYTLPTHDKHPLPECFVLVDAVVDADAAAGGAGVDAAAAAAAKL